MVDDARRTIDIAAEICYRITDIKVNCKIALFDRIFKGSKLLGHQYGPSRFGKSLKIHVCTNGVFKKIQFCSVD